MGNRASRARTRKPSTPSFLQRNFPSQSPTVPDSEPFIAGGPFPANTSKRRRKTVNQIGEDAHRPANANLDFLSQDTKDPATVDWYTEGPGRRVGYEDLTSIDWIFEYAKERQRRRILDVTAKGLLGYLHHFADASQIWLVLIFTGIATGLLAACIDVFSDWLGDLKTGICTAGEGGGRFYLNKEFCCWGLDAYAQCQDWYSWPAAFGLTSDAGSWILGSVFFILFSVLFAVGASVFVLSFSQHAKQSGIPEIKMMLGGFVMQNFLSTWTLVAKSLGLGLAVASGLWLGKEGPLVHVACCCANLFLRFSRQLNENEARKREVLSAAAAAGISVAFGAPVGGVLFSLEQLSYYFPDRTMWQSFVCAMIAAVTLQAFNPFRTGKLVLYQVTYSTGWHAFEIAPFALLGILGGIYGGLFIKLNMRVAKWRKNSRLAKSPVLEVAAFAVLTAIVNYPNKFMRAQSSQLVATLFAECSELTDDQLGLCGMSPAPAVMSSLLAAAFLGFLLAAGTFGLRIPAGIILPSMCVGALYGRAVGLLMRTWHLSYPNAFLFSTCEPDVPCVTAGTYAIIGAASALGGATRMTVSIVVIMFELTGALTYVLPIMVSVMLSKWVGDAFGSRGIYESWIHFNGYPFLDNRDDAAAAAVPDTTVMHVMTRGTDLVVLPATGHTIASLETLLRNQPYRGFPVVSDNTPAGSILLGYISRAELAFALRTMTSAPRSLPPTADAFFVNMPGADANTSLDLRPWMDQTPITLSSRSSLQLSANFFLKLGLRYLLFVDKGRLKGMMTRKDVWLLLDQASGESDATFRDAPIDRVSEGEGQGEASGLLSQADEGDVR